MITPLRKISVPRPALLADITVVGRMWRAALAPGKKLPQYEDVVLGSLGRLADHLLLFEGEALASFKVLRAGRKINDWIGTDVRGKGIADMPRDCALALGAVLTQSLDAAAPVPYRMHRVADGMVETYEMLAFPMASRWGPPLAGVYVAEAGTRYNLVDTIFRSSHEGIVALAAIRNAAGEAIDFQIVAFNQGAAEMLGVDEQHLAVVPAFRTAAWDRPRSVCAIGSSAASGRDVSISSSSPFSARTAKSTSTSASHRLVIYCP